ncbi:hypothetical protein ACET3Z_021337 [Daucus carota]
MSETRGNPVLLRLIFPIQSLFVSFSSGSSQGNEKPVLLLMLLHPTYTMPRGKQKINLSYSSVTDVGLLTLANFSCLQSLTILHLKGLTPSGLGTTLLACEELTKVNLHVSFRTLFPRLLIKYLETCGCSFQWREKEFRAELDPKCWKLGFEKTE